MLMIKSFCALSLLFLVTGYEVERLYSNAKLSLGRDGSANPSPASSGCPMACDLRSCPVVNVDTCSGRIEMDRCQCCPVCNMTYVATNQSLSGQSEQLEADDPEACEKIQCPRQQICLLNIQGIAVCRCPSSIYCRNRPRKSVCSEEGTTYRSMCYLKMQACEEDRRIALKHKGPCAGSKEAEREQRVQRRKEKQEKREQRLEKRKQKEERRDKKNRRENAKQAKLEKQGQDEKPQKKERKDRPSQGGKRRDKTGKKVNGKKYRKEELRDERRRHRRRLRKIMKKD